MPRPDEYRVMAGECFQWAREAQTEDERLVYLTLAQTWLEEAVRQDGASQIRLPPTPVFRRSTATFLTKRTFPRRPLRYGATRVSCQAIVRRARDLKRIGDRGYKYYQIEMNSTPVSMRVATKARFRDNRSSLAITSRALCLRAVSTARANSGRAAFLPLSIPRTLQRAPTPR
jgi:hypothetical protein